MKKILSVALALCMTAVGMPALAGPVELNGTVVSDVTQNVFSNYGGTVEQVLVREGQKVSAGDVLAVLKTTGVYAKESGTVYLFGSVGDDAAYVAEVYGSVASLEPDVAYTVTGSTKYAYDSSIAQEIHPGETVSLYTTDGLAYGRGILTTVGDSSFEVLVTTPGTLGGGDTVYIYRGLTDETASRLGRGSLTRRGPTAYTAEGIIVRYAVSSGQRVEKGGLLFETLSGTYRGETGDLTLVTAPSDGVVASLSVSVGTTVASGTQIAALYPLAGLRVEAAAAESDLAGISRGDTVQVEMIYADSGSRILPGKVEYISAIGTEDTTGETEEASYAVWVVLDSVPDSIAYGMNAIVTTVSREEEARTGGAETVTEPAAEEAAADGE